MEYKISLFSSIMTNLSELSTYSDGKITCKFIIRRGSLNRYKYGMNIYQINNIKGYEVKRGYVIIYADIMKREIKGDLYSRKEKKENLKEIKIPRVFEKEEEFFDFLREHTIKEV